MTNEVELFKVYKVALSEIGLDCRVAIVEDAGKTYKRRDETKGYLPKKDWFRTEREALDAAFHIANKNCISAQMAVRQYSEMMVELSKRINDLEDE